MIKLIVADLASARRHRLNALAISWVNQPGNIGRTHPRSRPVPQRRDKRRKPLIKIGLPIYVH
jgi:hypothetical protein